MINNSKIRRDLSTHNCAHKGAQLNHCPCEILAPPGKKKKKMQVVHTVVASVCVWDVQGSARRAASGLTGPSLPYPGHLCGYEQQSSGEQLQAVGEPGQAQRPAEGGLDVGQALRPHQALRLCQRLVGVDDVETRTAESQQAWMWK